jgi:hypothetical protein
MLRRRRRRRQEAEARIRSDAVRALGFLESVLAEARRRGLPVEDGVQACLTVLRAWAGRIDRP